MTAPPAEVPPLPSEAAEAVAALLQTFGVLLGLAALVGAVVRVRRTPRPPQQSLGDEAAVR